MGSRRDYYRFQNELIAEGVISVSGGHHKQLHLVEAEQLISQSLQARQQIGSITTVTQTIHTVLTRELRSRNAALDELNKRRFVTSLLLTELGHYLFGVEHCARTKIRFKQYPALPGHLDDSFVNFARRFSSIIEFLTKNYPSYVKDAANLVYGILLMRIEEIQKLIYGKIVAPLPNWFQLPQNITPIQRGLLKSMRAGIKDPDRISAWLKLDRNQVQKMISDLKAKHYIQEICQRKGFS